MMRSFLSATALALLLASPAAAQQATSETGATTNQGTAQTTTSASTTQQPDQVSADKLIGQDIQNAAGEEIGEIKSVILNQNGTVESVIVGVGGFLGLGEREVAIGWDELKVSPDGEQITANYTKDQLKAMPEYEYADEQKRGTAITRDGTRAPAGTAATAPVIAPAAPGQVGTTTTADREGDRPVAGGEVTERADAAMERDRDNPQAAGQQSEMVNALGDKSAEEIIGQNVVNARGENVGEIEDIVMDQNQKIFAVVSVGGFLGMGDKDVAVPFDELQLGDNQVIMMSQASEEELKEMPAYKAEGYESWNREGPVMQQR